MPAKTKTQHTPGPWRHTNRGSVIGADNCAVVSCQDCRLTDEAVANARLIAAAPDLLAALIDLVERCDGEEGIRADGSNIETMRAHAAISRAQGDLP